MAEILSSLDADFSRRLEAIIKARRRVSKSCVEQTAEVVARIEQEGEQAVRDFAQRWDGLTDADPLRLPTEAIAEVAARASDEERRALRFAEARIRAFHKHQRQAGYRVCEESGMRLEARVSAIEAVALYIPGGHHPYPSTLLMTGVPARLAGVPRLVATTPATRQTLSPLLALAFQMLEIDEVYSLGGAQAVAALALGCKSIPPVDLIVGPGNAWVREAKRQMFGRVGIDSLAGPSEVLILADSSAQPAWLAADLLAQAEHDADACATLLCDDEQLMTATLEQIKCQLALLPQDSPAALSWQKNGLCLLTENLQQGALEDVLENVLKDVLAIVKRLAPEHVQVITRNARELAQRIECAGCVFVGAYAPTALGDYVAGTNHVLPTAGAARFASGLSVETFTRRTTIVEASWRACQELAPHAVCLARAEGLEAHARSLEIRKQEQAQTKVMGGNA